MLDQRRDEGDEPREPLGRADLLGDRLKQAHVPRREARTAEQPCLMLGVLRVVAIDAIGFHPSERRASLRFNYAISASVGCTP